MTLFTLDLLLLEMDEHILEVNLNLFQIQIGSILRIETEKEVLQEVLTTGEWGFVVDPILMIVLLEELVHLLKIEGEGL